METTRTSSPYFSPNSARAPEARASSRPSGGSSPRRSGARCGWRCPRPRRAPPAVIGFGWAMSKRSRSGATSEPFCATWSPRTWRSASCSRWVAEWLARVAERRRVVDRELDRHADPRAFPRRPILMDDEVAELLLRVGDRGADAGRRHLADVADLAAGLAVERRLVEDEPALLAGFQRLRPRRRP